MRRHVEKHVENLREKPEHIRHRIAMGTAAGVTGLIALIWAVSLAGSGTLALTGPRTVAEDATESFADTRENFTELMGAVGESLGATSTEPELRIVDGDTTSTLVTPPPANQTGETVISF